MSEPNRNDRKDLIHSTWSPCGDWRHFSRSGAYFRRNRL